MRGRQEGMSYALKIAKEGGLEALEKEIKYRNIENYWYMGLNKKETQEVKEKIAKLLAINGKQSVDDIHKKLGHIMWENVGMARTKESLEKAIVEIQALRKEFWKDVKVVGRADDFNVELEKALRLADFLELGELMARDALNREESCGGHFRVEHQTEEGEAKRDDEHFVYAAVWEYKGENEAPELTKEPLNFEFVHPAQRNYKD